MTGWKRRSSAGSPRIHLSYSPPVVAPMIRMSPRTRAGFSMLAASMAAPSAVPWPMRLCSSSTNRIRSGSADSSRTSFRMRSSYWPRNVVPARRATWSSATTRTSFKAGGTSPPATRWTSPSTIAVFPTPAFPIRAGLFLLCRSRMSTTRAISASRQRTGSKSPRRAWVVRFTPTRSSTSPVSNSPSNGSLIQSGGPQESPVPVINRRTEYESHRGSHGEEYPERDVTLPFPQDQQWDVDEAAEQRAGEDRQQHALPADERPHHRHHLDVATAHRFFLEDPAAHQADGVQQREAGGGTQHPLDEARHAGCEGQAEPEDESGPVVLVGNEVMARIGDGDAEEDGAQHDGLDEAGRRSVGQHGGDPQDRDDRLDDGVLHGDRLTARATSAAQQQPRDHRHVVPPRDPAPAARAGRRRVKQRALLLVLLGEPQDADVEEAPHAEPQESGADEQDRINAHASPRRAGYPPLPRR